MSFRESLNVLKLLKKYQRMYPTALRPMLATLIRLDYENQCLKHDKVVDIRHEATFLKRLNRELDRIYPTSDVSRVDKRDRNTYDYPNVDFEISQQIHGSLRKRQFPSVGFRIMNLNNYPVKVRVKVRGILGGRSLGLIPDPKGYYNGKAEWGFDPFRGLINGNFTVHEECAKSNEELTLEVRVTVIDPDNREHELLPKSWTYMREENDWYYEPKLFTDEKTSVLHGRME